MAKYYGDIAKSAKGACDARGGWRDGGRRQTTTRGLGGRAREGEEVWGIVDRARREARSLGFMRR